MPADDVIMQLQLSVCGPVVSCILRAMLLHVRQRSYAGATDRAPQRRNMRARDFWTDMKVHSATLRHLYYTASEWMQRA